MALHLAQVDAHPSVQQALRRIAQQFPINGALIREETIERVHIVEKSLTGDLFVDGTITGTQIAAGTIEAVHLHVTELSAITANMGTLTSGLITGATIRTAAEGNRVVLDSAGLHAYKGVSTKVLDYDIETGALKLSGGTIEGGTVKGSTIEGVTIKASSKVEGGEIVGATFKTATSGARVEITGTSMKAINASGKEKLNFDFTTGIIAVTAVISAEEGSEIPTKVLSGQIKETQIENNAISTPKLQANSVTAAKMSVGELSAITANLGTVTAGKLEAVTIKGATIKGTTIEGGTGDFEGSLTALGLDIPAATEALPGTTNQARWLNEGSVIASAWARATNSNKNKLLILSADTAEANPAYFQAYVDAANSVQHARISTTHAIVKVEETTEKKAPKALVSIVKSGGEIVNRQLYDESEKSDFLQLTETAKRKINFGSSSVEFSGSVQEVAKTITHGLGVEPAEVFVFPSYTTTGFYLIANKGGTLNGTQFSVNFFAPQGKPTKSTATFYWMVTG